MRMRLLLSSAVGPEEDATAGGGMFAIAHMIPLAVPRSPPISGAGDTRI
jgi:hypothetical protein